MAWEEHAELGPLIERGCSESGDAEKVCYPRPHNTQTHTHILNQRKQARLLVYQSSGLKKTLALANKHIDLAVSAIEQLPPSEAQAALIQLARNLSTRKD